MSVMLPDVTKYVGAQYVSALMETIEHLDNLLNKNTSDIDVKNSFALDNLECLLILSHYGLGNPGEKILTGEEGHRYVEATAHSAFICEALILEAREKSQIPSALNEHQVRDYIKIEYQALQKLKNLQDLLDRDKPIYQDLRNFLSILLPYAKQMKADEFYASLYGPEED
ncbi:MAG: hypothetical protein WC584_04440 [Candidatus Pacearchaeota archaeon]